MARTYRFEAVESKKFGHRKPSYKSERITKEEAILEVQIDEDYKYAELYDNLMEEFSN